MKTSRIFFALFVSILVFVNTTLAQKSKVETVVKTFYAAIDAYDEAALNNSLSNDLQAMIPVSPMPFDKANYIMVGKGFTVMLATAVSMQPPVVPVTVYEVVRAGDAVAVLAPVEVAPALQV